MEQASLTRANMSSQQPQVACTHLPSVACNTLKNTVCSMNICKVRQDTAKKTCIIPVEFLVFLTIVA